MRVEVIKKVGKKKEKIKKLKKIINEQNIFVEENKKNLKISHELDKILKENEELKKNSLELKKNNVVLKNELKESKKINSENKDISYDLKISNENKGLLRLFIPGINKKNIENSEMYFKTSKKSKKSYLKIKLKWKSDFNNSHKKFNKTLASNYSNCDNEIKFKINENDKLNFKIFDKQSIIIKEIVNGIIFAEIV